MCNFWQKIKLFSLLIYGSFFHHILLTCWLHFGTPGRPWGTIFGQNEVTALIFFSFVTRTGPWWSLEADFAPMWPPFWRPGLPMLVACWSFWSTFATLGPHLVFILAPLAPILVACWSFWHTSAKMFDMWGYFLQLLSHVGNCCVTLWHLFCKSCSLNPV